MKSLRMKIAPEMTRDEISLEERARRWRQLEDVYLAQQISSYPHDYLETHPSVDRILETIDRFEEDLTDKLSVKGDLHVVLEVGEAILVDAKRPPRSPEGEDPILICIASDLQKMLDRLAQESPLWQGE